MAQVNTIFSTEDLDLNLIKWYNNGTGYACRHRRGDGKSWIEFAHRIVMERKIGRPTDWKLLKETCDHINHDRLDNRRENLRVLSIGDNARNRKDALRNVSGKYVKRLWVKIHSYDGWQVMQGGTYLKFFKTREEADRYKESELARLLAL